MLSLCTKLSIPDCQDPPARDRTNGAQPDDFVSSLQELVAPDLKPTASDAVDRPAIDLLAASADGAPNVVTLRLVEARQQGQSVLDDSYIAMNLRQAQRLVFGGADRVTGIVIQLSETAGVTTVQRLLQAALDKAGIAAEVKTLNEVNPTFDRVIRMFSGIFVFVTIVIGLVVLFTIVNTMTMSVMERVGEIGTLRALGLRRGGIRRQFLMEGALIGAIGATLGLLLALGLAYLLNSAGLTWMPPNSARPQPLRFLLLENLPMLIGPWIAMALVSTVSSLFPANRAARMTVVDAIRHV
jgi:putative ABC transport system permease protein